MTKLEQYNDLLDTHLVGLQTVLSEDIQPDGESGYVNTTAVVYHFNFSDLPLISMPYTLKMHGKSIAECRVQGAFHIARVVNSSLPTELLQAYEEAPRVAKE